MSQKILSCFILAISLAGCAPPPFKINATYDDKPKSDYFDRTMFASFPDQAKANADFIRRRIISSGNNETEKLTNLIIESGGNCTQSGNQQTCIIIRTYISSGCHRAECSKFQEKWQLNISWDRSKN
jgi:hypothetical protein